MSRPDPLSAVRRPRDPRIDAFRGLALAMIFIDHVPGNPYEAWTLRNWGFSDAAEAFFVMSGVAAGIAYSARFETRDQTGLWPAMAPLWSRAWMLYMVQMLLTVATIAIFAAAAAHYAMPDLLTKHNLKGIFQTPETVLPALPFLGHQIGYVNILPSYVVLLLVAPFAIMLGLRRPGLLMALSAALWLVAGLTRLNMPNFPGNGGWFLNPFTWQVIFVLGLAIGIRHRRGERLVPVSRPLFALCAGFLLFVLAWKEIPAFGKFMNYQMWRLGDLGLPYTFVTHNKTYLAVPRLLHVLALVYVLSCLPWVLRACGSRLAAPLRLMGQHGLLVFAIGTVLSMGFQAVMDGHNDAAWLGVILPPMGLYLLYAAAYIARHLRALKAPHRPAPVPAASEAPAVLPVPAAVAHAAE
ncbi:OpgC family protein [Ponticoccus sp. (in: a-proteobacteria)]|uniref:OpgC family protein n=1 Tax=Ponticoccus sp. (in: a-proteobacteria) TaxID=1925025 RepID=UPI003AB52F64